MASHDKLNSLDPLITVLQQTNQILSGILKAANHNSSGLWGDILTSLNPDPRIITASSGLVSATDLAIAIQRTGPGTITTILTLPAVATRENWPLAVWDWSTNFTSHIIRFTASSGETVMGDATYDMRSNPSGKSHIVLRPQPTLTGWSVG